MKQFLLVFVGGGFGSMLRYGVNKAVSAQHDSSFPWGTFVANVVGGFLIGVILTYIEQEKGLSREWTLLLATGFCGGFTTFSSFAYENNMLVKSGDYATFFLYTSLSIIVGFMATFGGIMLMNKAS